MLLMHKMREFDLVSGSVVQDLDLAALVVQDLAFGRPGFGFGGWSPFGFGFGRPFGFGFGLPFLGGLAAGALLGGAYGGYGYGHIHILIMILITHMDTLMDTL